VTSRRRTALVAAGVLTATISIFAQSWKTAALASFDDVWQTVNETFYDSTFGGLDWTAVKTELRPRVESAASPEDARAVIREMLARLKHSHFGLLSASSTDALPGPASVPIDVRATQAGVLITRVTHESGTAGGLAPGQTLISVDDQLVADMSRGTGALGVRGGGLEVWRRVNRVLHGSESSAATLRVRGPSGGERTITVRRRLPEGESVVIGNLPPLLIQFDSHEVKTPRGRRAGVFGFSVWMAPLNDRISDAVDRFRQLDGIVIDLRGNPGGLAAMINGVAGHFLADPVLLGTMRTRQLTLSFNANPRLATTDGRRVEVFGGPLAVLVDELTGSTSEIFAGSLQGLGRARVFGRQSMGQALPAFTKQLPLGDVLMYAIGDFKTAGGKSLEGAGVVPDLSVPLSPEALAAGRDEVMEAALRWIDEKKVAMLRPPASRCPSALGVLFLAPERMRLKRTSWE
jgi:carboxyl-terminal processing protease